MKRTLLYIAISAVAAFSCTKENNTIDTEKPQEEENVTPVNPGEYDPSEYLLGFGADLEKVDSKVSIDVDNGSLGFEIGDKVLVSVPATETSATYEYDGTYFVPTVEPIAVGSNVAYVYYPMSEYSQDNANVYFYLPDYYAKVGDLTDLGTKVPMAGIIPVDARDGEGYPQVTFKNLGSILRVRFNSSAAQGETITAVELSVTGANITGSGKISWSGDTDAAEPSVAALEGGGNSLKIDVSDGHLTNSAYKEFYFFLPASGTLSTMTVKAIYGKEGGFEPSETISRTSPMNLERNKIYKVQKTLKGFFSGGDGSENYPYQIATADDFKAIATLANATAEADGNGYDATAKRTFFGSTGVHYEQTADIEFNNDDPLTAIGVYNTNAFQGIYNGGGFKLKNFSITARVDGSAGLFEYLDGAKLTGINLVNARIEATNTAGLLAGRCIGATKIENCSLDGGQLIGRNSVGFIAHLSGNGSIEVKGCSVKDFTIVTAATGSSDANNQGGIVGWAGNGNPSIINCSTSGDILFTGTASGTARGGIVGKFDSTGEIKGCTNGASISNLLVNSTGGITGLLTKGSISECVNTGDVSGLGNVGGIVGLMSAASSAFVHVEKCRVDADITGKTNQCAGGIAGCVQDGVLNTCFAKGSVSSNSYDVGGIAGQVYANGTSAVYNRPYVYDCIAANDVTCTRSEGAANIGGVVGRVIRGNSYTNQYVAVDNCIGLNKTITSSMPYAGAFIGNLAGVKTNNDRARVRNCISLVEDSNFNVTPTTSQTGGFAGQYLGALVHCYYLVSVNNQTAADGTTAASNLTKSDLTTLTSAAFCEAHCSRATGYNLTVNGVQYKSSGWTKPDDVDYPVPTTLYNLGSEYYK